MRRLVLLAALGLGVAVSADAQRRGAASPEEVVRLFLAAVDEGRWMDAAQFVAPEMAVHRREEILSIARTLPVSSPVTAATLLQMDPEMPREVAEWMARRASERRYDTGDAHLFTGYAHVRDTATLAALSPITLIARALEAEDARFQISRMAEEDSRCGALLLANPPPASRRELLGVVTRRDTAWALHREVTVQPEDPDPFMGPVQPLVAVLVRQPIGWRIIPDRPLLTGQFPGAVALSCGIMGDSVPPG